jgi:type II secretory pathway pseudopilin PulG
MKIEKLKSNRSGETLIELMISMALLAIFMASLAKLITPASVYFQKVKALSYAESICDMMTEKIGGELSTASGKVVIDTRGSMISFNDSHSSPVYVATTDDGFMVMHYREVRVIENNQVGAVTWQAVDWKYDEKAYQGFIIKSMTFTKAAETNSVTISMDISNEKLGIDYKDSRTVECFNLADSDPIVTGTVYTSDDDYYNHYFD